MHLIQHWRNSKTTVRNQTVQSPLNGISGRYSIRTVRVIMKLQALILLATLAAAVAQEFLQEDENRDAKEDSEWELFKVFSKFNEIVNFDHHSRHVILSLAGQA